MVSNESTALMAKLLHITQTRSLIKEKTPMKRTMRALGILKMHQTVVHKDSPQMRGMIRRVVHLVTVKVV
ncbi:MAG: 50S ribosomal protein L30 [Planctomycetes bacterium]|nr:50S ribosomal protein L30 [Planctomycetota bacterium]